MGQNVRKTNTWEELSVCLHADIFSIRGVKNLRLLRSAALLMTKTISSGETSEKFYHELKEVMEKYGQHISRWQAEHLYLMYFHFYHSRRRRQEFENFHRAAPYWRFHSIIDERTNRIEAFFHNKIFLWDSPVWEILYPPVSFYGRASVETMSQRSFERGGYTLSEGKIITRRIRLRSGMRDIPGILCDGKEIWFNPNCVAPRT